MKFQLVLGVILLFVSSIAFADEASEARAHYKKATAHFAIAEFEQAAEEYQLAFMTKQDPALLFNAAQSHRLAGNHKKALILYKNYLNLYPHARNAADVRMQIEKLEQAVVADQKAKTSPPTGTVEPGRAAEPTVVAPAATETSAPSPQPDLTPAKTVDAESAPKPIYKKWWLWTAVGAVVVAAGVTTAVVLATRSSGSWTNAPTLVNNSLGVRW